MNRIIRYSVFTICLISITTTSSLQAQIIDPVASSATIDNPPAHMTIAPGGFDSFLDPVPHVIDVYVCDSSGNPIEVIASDIWLQNDDVTWCPGGAIADSSTYGPDPGHTTFSGTPQGGVLPEALCSEFATRVIALGYAIEILELRFSSMDLNGNGAVNLVDFAQFGVAFYTDNQCANFDKSIGSPLVTLADFAIFASVYNNSQCP
jgi:hypothetical protein